MKPRPSDAGAALAVAWNGAPPAVVATVADRAGDLAHAAALLLTSGDAACIRVGQQITAWLEHGGPLEVRLGVRPRPGQPSAPVALRSMTRNQKLREHAKSLKLATRNAQAKAIARALAEREPRTLALVAEIGALPGERQLVRVLRSTDG